MLSFAGAAKAADYDWRPVRVVDGDTIEFDASSHILVPELADVKVRIRGVDTPETWRPECESERDAGEAATALVKDTLAGAVRVAVRDPEWGRYGGRVVAGVIVDGEDLGALLIRSGLGRAYDGGKRGGWCD